MARGRRPSANTADRGPVTRPIRKYLINDNFINKLIEINEIYSIFIILPYDSLEMVKISFRPNPDYKYMYDDCVYQMKEQNKSLNQFIGKKLNSVNTEKLGQ